MKQQRLKIILGLTGSVASVLYTKLVNRLEAIGNVEIVATNHALHFCPENRFLLGKTGYSIPIHTDTSEWQWYRESGARDEIWKKNDPILHIDLRDRGSALVIAPCSANTLAKIANGMCDNLLLSVLRAWDMERPVFIAPAMNTKMWNHPVTAEHIKKLESWGYHIILPQSKLLACGDTGVGAMANIDNIVLKVDHTLRWSFPLIDRCTGIPVGNHPGAFFTKRKFENHTGVDLYTDNGTPVYAVENGTVVNIEPFTGPQIEMPWWNDTNCVLVEGASGVVVYGEITPYPNMKVGHIIKRNERVGHVKRVLKEGKERPDIEGHSTSMLHIELYPHKVYTSDPYCGQKPGILRDPTPHLMSAWNAPNTILKGPNETSENANACGCSEKHGGCAVASP